MTTASGSPPEHGSAALRELSLDAYNSELRDDEGFVGDRASKRAFVALLEAWRHRLALAGRDALGNWSIEESVDRMDALLAEGDADAAAIILSALEEFAQELASVLQQFLALDPWRGTQRVVIGGGLRSSRVGELAIARASLLLNAPERPWVELVPICHDPDEAGLIGAAYLVPDAVQAGHDSILAADIGGSNLRCGIVALGGEGRDARVTRAEQWVYGEEEPTRDAMVERLAETLKGLIDHAAADGNDVAPFIGIGCPGVIGPDGSIARGGQNLPGDWEAADFNLPAQLREAIPTIGGRKTVVVLHNDAVLQGLSMAPFQDGVTRWGVLTIGTGLGNARFSRAASR